MATDIVRQNTGFIAAETQRAQSDIQRSKQFRTEGNDRAAKAFETRATNRMERVNKAATTIMNRTSGK